MFRLSSRLARLTIGSTPTCGFLSTTVCHAQRLFFSHKNTILTMKSSTLNNSLNSSSASSSLKILKVVHMEETSESEMKDTKYFSKKARDFEDESTLSFPFDEPILKRNAKCMTKDHAVSWCNSDTCIACTTPKYPVFVPSRKPRRAPPLAGTRWWDESSNHGFMTALFRCAETSGLDGYLPVIESQNPLADIFRCW